MTEMRAILALEDGTVFEGVSFGATGEAAGEVVFNTSMMGYQEILTDPSYKGQIVTMTYPLIGNYGISREDCESHRPWVEGFVVRELSRVFSNWRSHQSLGEFMLENNLLGIQGIDTRALTRHIRLRGAMKGVISTVDLKFESLVERAKASPGLIGRDLVKEVTTRQSFWWQKDGQYRVVVIDCGVKYNILRQLSASGWQVKVVPAETSAQRILGLHPEGVLISNGPGDPEGVPYVVETVRQLIGKVPIFGICLGHQILGLAFSGRTYKLKFGHHGANHPVKDLATGKIAITVQNHGFCVDMDSLNKEKIEISYLNLYDGTLEGMRHRELPIFSVQFHPEASPGPHDTSYLFRQFVHLMKEN